MERKPLASESPDSETEATSSQRFPWEAILAYLPVFCLYSWMIRDTVPGLKEHARQGMTLFIIELLLILLKSSFVYSLLWLVIIVLAGLGIWSVYEGRSFQLPSLTDLWDHITNQSSSQKDPEES